MRCFEDIFIQGGTDGQTHTRSMLYAYRYGSILQDNEAFIADHTASYSQFTPPDTMQLDCRVECADVVTSYIHLLGFGPTYIIWALFWTKSSQ